MAIRLRKINNRWIALCAVETDKKKNDIYLDDGIHYALACKFASEWGCWEDKIITKLMDSQKVRDAKEEIVNWLNRKKTK